MANICCFVMRVKGKKENVLKFQRIITRDRTGMDVDDEIFAEEISKCFYKWIEECNVYNEKETKDGEYVIEMSGDCAWSVSTAMLSNGTGIYNIEDLSQDLKLKIEVYSEEYGIGFQEHYFFDNGNQLIDEICTDAFEFYIENEDDLKEVNELYGTSYIMDDVEDGYIHIGGYGDWDFEI